MLQNRAALKEGKNLLAFSAGVDSSALLFLLLEEKISFDIAIVDYGVREQSKDEVAYAKSLAQEHGFECFVHQAKMIEKNFEANARKIRYDFFDSLIEQHNYTNLLTAHHLGDRFEWMLMQFCKGAGCVELAGMRSLEKRQGYKLIRPLLHLDKSDLLEYLHKTKRHYFIDASNSDEKYTRNTFRHNYALPLLEQYKKGIAKSFAYIDEDSELLSEEIEIEHSNALAYFPTSKNMRANIIAIDRELKRRGKLLSADEKKLLREEKSLVVGRVFVVVQTPTYTFIAPFIKQKSMPKEFKEKMRRLKIDAKLRGYLASDEATVSLLSLLFA